MQTRPPLLVGATIAACAAVLLIAASDSAAHVTHGFVSYYGAARLVLSGQFGPWVYDDAAYAGYLQDLTHTSVRDIFAPNTPAMALLALPVSWLPPHAARIAWLALSLIALLATVSSFACARRARRTAGWTAVWTAIVLVNPAVLENLRTAQAYLVTLGVLTIAVRALAGKRDGKQSGEESGEENAHEGGQARDGLAGALLALPWERFLRGERDFAVLFTPAPRRSLAGYTATRHHVIVDLGLPQLPAGLGVYGPHVGVAVAEEHGHHRVALQHPVGECGAQGLRNAGADDAVGPEHADLLARMMLLAPKLALQEGARPYPEGGFRIVTNTGQEGGQEVHHLHWHVMGGPRPWLRG